MVDVCARMCTCVYVCCTQHAHLPLPETEIGADCRAQSCACAHWYASNDTSPAEHTGVGYVGHRFFKRRPCDCGALKISQ